MDKQMKLVSFSGIELQEVECMKPKQNQLKKLVAVNMEATK